jgi:phosphotransferase system enzyme I (PtsI)
MTAAAQEKTFRGIPASPGIALGRAVLLRRSDPRISPRKIPLPQVKEEVERFRTAIHATHRQLEADKNRVTRDISETVGRIFEAHLMILEDPVFLEEIETSIQKELMSADYLVWTTMERNYKSLKAQHGDFFQQRAEDIRDVRRRIISHLMGSDESTIPRFRQPVVIVADDLTPTDTLHLDPKYVQGLATERGGMASHTAILARSFQIPAVVGIKEITEQIRTRTTIIVNGNSGKVLINPLPDTSEEYEGKRKRYREFMANLADLKTLPAVSLDGRKVTLACNIEMPHEVNAITENGGKGIGLYRTEYLFLTSKQIPTEEEQFRQYDQVAEAIYPNPVVIRTFDLGGDKGLPGIEPPPERNPFLGWRAIRVSLTLEDMFKTQLRAILKASTRGNVKLMYPLISGLLELQQANKILDDVKKDLRKEKIPFDENMPVGIMIEVPSAVTIADLLAKEVDFFSIGTNDLIQYALAVDRGNQTVAYLYKPLHPALIRMIHQTVRAGHDAGIPVSMCGEMAGAPVSALLLLGMELDELSMSPVSVPEIKKIIRSSNFAEAKKLVHKVMHMGTMAQINDYLCEVMKKKFADLPIWFSADNGE